MSAGPWRASSWPDRRWGGGVRQAPCRDRRPGARMAPGLSFAPGGAAFPAVATRPPRPYFAGHRRGRVRAALAQSVRALDCGSRGPLFESGRRYHFLFRSAAWPRIVSLGRAHGPARARPSHYYLFHRGVRRGAGPHAPVRAALILASVLFRNTSASSVNASLTESADCRACQFLLRIFFWAMTPPHSARWPTAGLFPFWP